MRYVYWVRNRIGRLLVILLVLLIYFLLLTVDARQFFPHTVTNFSTLFLPWLRFGFSSLIALLFIAVGALVWLYARDRSVALLLFCFSFTMMVTFALETSAASNNARLLAISGASSSLALAFFAILLLLFPRNYFLLHAKKIEAVSGALSRSSLRDYSALLLRGYVALLLLLSIVTALYSFINNWLSLQLPDWLNFIVNSYYLLALTSILITIFVSYRQSSSLRERQQQRIFVSGVILAFAPFLLLTLLPYVLNLPQYVIDSQLSTITLGLLPLALGYSILRYQILVFDIYIRRAVARVVGGIGLAVLAYVVVVLSSTFLSSNELVHVIFVAVAMAVLGPSTWWLAKVVTEYLFFSEILHYRRLIDKPDMLASETFDLNEAALLFTQAVVNAFATQEVCLFVLDEDTGCYQLFPLLKEDDPYYAPRAQLAQRLFSAAKSSIHERTHSLQLDGPIIKRVASAKRPLLLSEASKLDEEMPAGLARYLATSGSPDGTEPVLTPVRAHGKMIGILALGERGDYQQYAGADFEAIHLMLSRFSSVLETARLYAAASRHIGILNSLYSASTMPIESFETIEEVATTYARVAAEAVIAGCEIWLFDEKNHRFQHVTHEGMGPQMASPDHPALIQEYDWSPQFYEGDSWQAEKASSIEVPSYLQQTCPFPCAWLPLSRGRQRLGILVLTYPRPHIFSHEEKRVLAMFASQCAIALENASITIELRAAYERQKELDRLKDQFIMTASHELRTPLTAVQGYIELLNEYNLTLSPASRADFIAKANRGCDELSLLVGNIMDASRVQIDAENIKLCQVSLAGAVQDVLEILEAMTRRENRTVQVDIPAHVRVMADDMRLRQVLLNLVSNALKYSPGGTNVEITSDMNDEHVTLKVSDHGQGIPRSDQDHLFERFVRLERDMNSPIRGAGLGLYISKQLIEAMGGRIWVESSGISGSGSTFAFTLARTLVDNERNSKQDLTFLPAP